MHIRPHWDVIRGLSIEDDIFAMLPSSSLVSDEHRSRGCRHTHTHTHTHRQREREKERERERVVSE